MMAGQRFWAGLLILLACSFSSMVSGQAAQAPAGTPAVAQPPSKPASTVLLREGSEVRLKFADDLSSKTAHDDDAVMLILTEDLKVGDVVVAQAGCKAVGTVTGANKAGRVGRPGMLKLRLDYLTVGNRQVKLRGATTNQGTGKTGTAAALGVLFGPVGLTKRGSDVEIKAGTPITAYVDEDIEMPALE